MEYTNLSVVVFMCIVVVEHACDGVFFCGVNVEDVVVEVNEESSDEEPECLPADVGIVIEYSYHEEYVVKKMDRWFHRCLFRLLYQIIAVTMTKMRIKNACVYM